MRAIEFLKETKKKDDVKWIAKLKDGKTKTVWAKTRYDAEQKLGTSILIQKGYTIKKAPVNESKSYQAPEIKAGDNVKVGKFKNRKATVKSISKDKNNQPVLQTDKGEHKLFKPRIDKLEEGDASQYNILRQLSKAADDKCTAASKALDKFPKGPMGLTPDAVKRDPAWQKLKKESDQAFAELRHYNGLINKNHKKEHRAARNAERAARYNVQEGGWEDTITQKTKLNPAIVKSALQTVELFVAGLNKYLHSQSVPPVKMGHPLGSTAYVNVDTEDTEYGDIDMQMIAPAIEGKSSFQLTKFYNEQIDQFIAATKPDYIYDKGKPTNGHPIFKLADDVYVQVDMLWTVERLAKWDRWRKTPMQGVKGLIMGNLYSTLGEVINMSLQSAVLMKLTGGDPINYQRGRNPDEIIEVTKDIENFGLDILNYVNKAVKGVDGAGKARNPIVDSELQQYPGLNTESVQISDVVHTIKGLAKSFQLNNLYGKHVLKDYKDADDLLQTYLKHYLDKADKAGKGAKLDKAKTPEELAQVQLLRDKIAKGVKLVKQAFASDY